MKHNLFLFILILALTVFLDQQGQASILNSVGRCDEYADQMKDAIKRIDDIFAQQDVSCLPADLESIMKDRLNDPMKISIHCDKEKHEREIELEIFCGIDIVLTFETDAAIPEGSIRDIFVYDENNLKDVEKLTSLLFHELIHISENYYSQTHNGPSNGTSEKYTYTCTKQCFPNANNCPGGCEECNTYKKPNLQ